MTVPAIRYQTPETPDGIVRKIESSHSGASSLDAVIEFRVSREFKSRCEGRAEHVAFAARSRIARLGIDVEPISRIEFENGKAYLTARISANVQEYGVGAYLESLVIRDLRLGRLVLCPPENQLSSDEIYSELEHNEFQLPSGYSIGADGSFTIQTHKLVYGLSKELTLEDALAILTQEGGKSILNRLQVPKAVDNLVIPAGQGLITSCSMFLHKHYAVINPNAGEHGRHLNAIVLDPVATRGTRVFLEISNSSTRQIVNPFVTAKMYTAEEKLGSTRVYAAPKLAEASNAPTGVDLPTFEQLSQYYETQMPPSSVRTYQHRPLIVIDDWNTVREQKQPSVVSTRPEPKGRAHTLASFRSTVDYSVVGSDADLFATRVLTQLPEGKPQWLLLEYFPNLIEHISICNAILAKRVGGVVFRRASFEHGQFFSANDHTRLADYEALGAKVLWLHEERGHIASHAFRGLRGYFVEPGAEQRFRNSLVVAVYGSAAKLNQEHADGLRELLVQIKELFSGAVAILTGGGPGAMQQGTDIALEQGLLVGANYIETIDQGTNKAAHFYQCFQDRNRHNRQRWFDIASFTVFCVGGLGTLEEVGLTLTDMKLGMVERGPVVFFGKYKDDAYWSYLKQLFERMVAAERAPQWVMDNILFTGDATRLTPFYKRVLGLG